MVIAASTLNLLTSATASRREEYWIDLLGALKVTSMLEIGVWQGEFARDILRSCPMISLYYMIDPWRHLDEWNKPFNVEEGIFERVFADAMNNTNFAEARRLVLRGTSTEVIERIPDKSLDFIYVDGDHTLRGITVDLLCAYPKLRPGGIIAGDDYSPSVWQHGDDYEPSFVCPYAAYFAEGQGAPIVILENDQFAIVKPETSDRDFRIIDTTGRYSNRSLLWQLSRRR